MRGRFLGFARNDGVLVCSAFSALKTPNIPTSFTILQNFRYINPPVMVGQIYVFFAHALLHLGIIVKISTTGNSNSVT